MRVPENSVDTLLVTKIAPETLGLVPDEFAFGKASCQVLYEFWLTLVNIET